MQVAAELPKHIRGAERSLSEAERQDVIHAFAANPRAGVLLEETGGVRKPR